MSTAMQEYAPVETTNLDRYGFPELPWSRPQGVLEGGSQGPEVTWFLGTVSPSGRPHAAGVGAVWFQGDLYFTANLDTLKARHLAASPLCTISARLPGIDLVFEGTADVIGDDATLNELVKIFNRGGWPATVENGAFVAPFSAPSAGPPPWHVWRIRYSTVFGVATEEPYGATRWRFAG